MSSAWWRGLDFVFRRYLGIHVWLLWVLANDLAQPNTRRARVAEATARFHQKRVGLDNWWSALKWKVVMREAYLWPRYYLLLAYWKLELELHHKPKLRGKLVIPKIAWRPIGPTPYFRPAGIAFMPTVEKWATGYETTTTADPGSGGTSLAVTTRTGSPPSGEFYLLIQDSQTNKANREWVRVTGGHGTGAGSFTVVRGQEGSTGVAHASGSYVALVVTDSSMHGIPSVINPLRDPYNAVGDGTAVDYTALNSAFTDSVSTGRPIVSPPGFTYLIDTTIVVGGACSADFGMSTIKKATSMTTQAITLNTSGININYLQVDGSRAIAELQKIDASGAAWTGTFSFGGNTTSALANTSTAAQVQTALGALASIGSSNVRVKGSDINGVSPWYVTFINTMAGVNQAQITANLTTGTNPTITTVTNGAAGATGGGIRSLGGTAASPNTLERVIVKANSSHGIYQDSGTPFLIARSCQANDNTSHNSPGGVIGFKIDNGTYWLLDCDANNNEFNGYRFVSSASSGCKMSGRTFQTGIAPDTFTNYASGVGLQINSNHGICDSFRGLDDLSFGVQVTSASTTYGASAAGWEFDSLIAKDTGRTGLSATGTGVQFLGSTDCQVGMVIGNRCHGYALSLGRNTTSPSVGASGNSFGNVLGDGTGALDSDPGMNISGDSSNNYIGNATFKNYTVAVSIGEDTQPLPNPSANPLNINGNNVIGQIYAQKNVYGVLLINMGYRTRVESIVSRNCANVDTALLGGLVTFYPDRTTTAPFTTKDTSWVFDNVVREVDHKTDNFTVSTTTGNAVTPITVTTSEYHNIETGDTVIIASVGGNTAANGTFVATRTGQKTFTVPATGNGAYTSGGTVIFRKPSHIIHTSTNARNNTVARIIHRGDFNTAVVSNADASNLIPSDSPAIARRVQADRTTTVATAANVTDMSFYVQANEQWSFELDLVAGCSGAGGVKYAFTFPTGATFRANVIGPSTTNATFASERITATATLTTQAWNQSNAAGWNRISGQIVNGATAGVVQLQFASGTGTQTSTIAANSELDAKQTY